MFRFLILLVLIGTTFGSPTRPFFFSRTTHHRIVGGVEATPHEFPFMIDITRPPLYPHYCGGSIINERWILTAAHCSLSSTSGYVIVAGEHDQEEYEGIELRRSIARIVLHPGYNDFTLDNDAALWELAVPLVFSPEIQPVRLPLANFMPASDNSTVAGWGALTESGSSPTRLYKVGVPLVSNTRCGELYSSSGYDILDSMICAGEAGKDSCQGDSGGPMICDSAEGPVHCGIVSWGIGCAREGYPGVYGRTSHFISWMETVIGEKLV